MAEYAMTMEQPSVTVPTIFQPICLRNGYKYRALLRYCFDADEKMWVCNHIISSCEDIEISIVGDIILFCNRYRLNQVEW